MLLLLQIFLDRFAVQSAVVGRFAHSVRICNLVMKKQTDIREETLLSHLQTLAGMDGHLRASSRALELASLASGCDTRPKLSSCRSQQLAQLDSAPVLAT